MPLYRAIFQSMSKLASLFRIFRLRRARRDDEERLHDARADARTDRMVDGRGLSPTGAVMDFESDAEPPHR
jgi:hypothetical protein